MSEKESYRVDVQHAREALTANKAECRRKRDQHWALADWHGWKGDKAEEQRHTNLARYWASLIKSAPE